MRQWIDDALFIQNSCNKEHAVLQMLSFERVIFIFCKQPIVATITPLLSALTHSSEELGLEAMLATIQEQLHEPLAFGALLYDKTALQFVATDASFQLQYLSTKKSVHTVSAAFNRQRTEPKVQQLALQDVATLCITSSTFVASLYQQYAPYFSDMKQLNAIAALYSFEVSYPYFFLNHYALGEPLVHFKHAIEPSLPSIESLQSDVELILQENFDDTLRNGDAEVIMSELLMNAFEYGVLQIDPAQKQHQMEQENYFNWLGAQHVDTNKRITLTLTIYKNNLLRVSINDDSEGFDYSSIVNALIHQYHGRGVTMVASMADAFFYQDNGATATFFIHYFSYEQPQLYMKTLYWVSDQRSIINKKRLRHFFGPKCGTFKIFPSLQELSELMDPQEEAIIVLDTKHLHETASALQRMAPKSIRFYLRGDESIDAVEYLRLGLHGILLKHQSPDEHAKQMTQALLQYRFLQAKKSKQVRHEKAALRAFDEQQKRALQKQMLVVHDERHAIDSARCNIYYEPFEKVSGDIYSIKRVHQHAWVAYIIDSMGKGIAASVTAIMAAAFLNRAISVAISYGTFEFDRMVTNFVEFIVPNLLDNEVLSCAFVYYDAQSSQLSYSGFGMYPLLLKHQGTVQEVAFSQPPLMQFLHETKIRQMEVDINDELLFYSDGLCEMENFSLAQLKTAFTAFDGSESFEKAVRGELQQNEADDDITFLHFTIDKATKF